MDLHECARLLSEDYLPDGWERVHSSTYSRVAYNRDRQLYYKEFLPRSPVESLKALVRGSRARRARLRGEALLWAGIDAPANIAWGKLPRGREYLFTAAAPGEDMDRWLRHTLADRTMPNLRQRRRLLAALGTFVGRVHATGFVHGDLRPGNVVAAWQHDRFRFTLLDNERVRKRAHPSGKMLLRNLMQLNMLPPSVLSRADRMCFFRAWQSQMRELTPVEAKVLGAEAYRWAMRRMDEKGWL